MITKILGGAAALLFVLLLIVFKLYLGEVHDHERYRAQVEAVQQLAQDAADERDRLARENTAKVAGIYGDRLTDVERSYISRLDRVERLRQQAGRDATAQTVAASTRLPDAEPADRRSDPEAHAGPVCPEVETEFRHLERDCAKTTVMLYGLQDYVLEVCK